MQIPDRAVPPSYQEVRDINLHEAKKVLLANGFALYYVNAGTEDLIRLEIIFPAGIWHESKRLIAATTNDMLNEGTVHHNAKQLAEKIDYYGAYFKTNVTGDTASVSLFTLNKHLENVLPVLKEILTESVFPENELTILKQNRKQSLTINNEKVDYIAHKKFNEALFGANHPYGYYATTKDYDNISRNDLIDFYQEHYLSGTHSIIVSGKVDQAVIQCIDAYFGNYPPHKKKKDVSAAYKHPIQPATDKKVFIDKKGAIQSAITIGKRLFTKNHPDYQKMLVLNTILGGYFGSRLMSNIREKKGYTYGISSAPVSYIHEGYFVISTEVGKEVCKNTIDEIFIELKRLCEEPVGKEELTLVKNYMMGHFLRSFDGAFALADRFKSLLLYGQGYDYYKSYMHTVGSITTEEILELANKYLKEDSFYEIVVGSP